MAGGDRRRERAAWRRFVEVAADIPDAMTSAADAAVLPRKEAESPVFS
jgi:hypothetical protein